MEGGRESREEGREGEEGGGRGEGGLLVLTWEAFTTVIHGASAQIQLLFLTYLQNKEGIMVPNVQTAQP